MFEVIALQPPTDDAGISNLEILRDAYTRLGRSEDALRISVVLIAAYIVRNEFSLAILQCESILSKDPDNSDVQLALRTIESLAIPVPTS